MATNRSSQEQSDEEQSVVKLQYPRSNCESPVFYVFKGDKLVEPLVLGMLSNEDRAIVNMYIEDDRKACERGLPIKKVVSGDGRSVNYRLLW